MEASQSTWITPLVKQWCVVSAILFNKFGQGMALGMTSSLIAALQKPDSEMKIDTVIASWLGTTIGIGCLIGYPIGSYLMHRFGRKLAYIIMNLPTIVGFILSTYAHTVAELLIGKILFGICGGSTGILGVMIIGEFNSPEYRGMFLILNTAFLNTGSLVVHLVSNYIGWRTLSLINIIPFVITIIICCFWPESPHWLAEQQKFKKSEKSFYWLRGKSLESTKEINEIINNNQNKKVRRTFFENCQLFLMKFKKKNFVKPFFIIIIGAIMFECSGRHTIPIYSILILQGMTSNPDDLFQYSLIIDTIITLSTFLSAFLTSKYKLRPLMFTTGTASVILLNLACLSLYLISKEMINENYNWFPLGSFCLYIILCNLSCTPVPFSLGGEIFPQEHRAIGSAIYGYILGIALTLVLIVTPFLLEQFNTYGAFLVFAIGLLITLVAMYFMLPETKDKTLQEIDDFFTYGKKSKTTKTCNDGQDEIIVEMTIRNKSENTL